MTVLIFADSFRGARGALGAKDGRMLHIDERYRSVQPRRSGRQGWIQFRVIDDGLVLEVRRRNPVVSKSSDLSALKFKELWSDRFGCGLTLSENAERASKIVS